MNTATRIKIYLVIAIVYVSFIWIEGAYDIWPHGLYIIGGLIVIIEIGTYISIKLRE